MAGDFIAEMQGLIEDLQSSKVTKRKVNRMQHVVTLHSKRFSTDSNTIIDRSAGLPYC
jgi:hypothetical protein